jgi:hypothetical protein
MITHQAHGDSTPAQTYNNPAGERPKPCETVVGIAW